MTREQGTGNRLQVTGNRLQVTGNRLQVTGNRFWATLLFVTCVGFFPFTYLVKFSEF
ncbi:MAG: hypothetical protein ACK5RY_01420 [Dolichospermum sp.]|nr:hypothetical protein [Anabaena sp. 49628_E55]